MHLPDPERPHGTHSGHSGRGGSPSGGQSAYQASMDRMHRAMGAGIAHPDPDVAFTQGMLAHHEAAIEMAEIQLRDGKDAATRKLAVEIMEAQKKEVAQMRAWLAQRGVTPSTATR